MNSQVLIVDTENKQMDVYENDNLIKTINDVWIGKNGVVDANDMKEGINSTPLGEYNLGIAFGTEDLDVNYPYIKIDDNSYWVDDVNSEEYNMFVEVGNKANSYDYSYIKSEEVKTFTSAEHLIDYPQQYKYAVFIEYNSGSRRVLGNGSAIFLHCHGTKGYTGGCIAIKEEDMKWIINFLDTNKSPKIKICKATI